MATEEIPMDKWKNIDWKKIEKNVFKLQRRIYRASNRGDQKTVYRLQKLLTKSRSAKLLAVRRVTQDNQGKKTAGIDGIKSLTPSQRYTLASNLKIGRRASPVRRVWIPKPGTSEKRGLGIPTMYDRALQTLIKSTLEPEWEARFENNSYGFRPARSCHDAIEAIFNAIKQKAKWVLDADIAKCFDRIDQKALLKKINTIPVIRRQIKAWLKAGMVDNGELYPTKEGVPQGGTVSPLLMNIALHGLETVIKTRSQYNGRMKVNSPIVVRYADDLVILHEEKKVIEQCQSITSEWLKEMGLELKPSKTKIVHTLKKSEAGVGFDFLGFSIRQYRVGKTKSGKTSHGKLLGFKTFIKPSKQAIKNHTQRLKEEVCKQKAGKQEELIKILNPIIVGWCNFYSTVVSKKIFGKIGTNLFATLLAWATRRHPKKSKTWIAKKYWRIIKGKGWIFQPTDNDRRLTKHVETPIKRHQKVQGHRSPYDGDWVYWSKRLGCYPRIPKRVARLLKEQKGKCRECGLFFTEADLIEIDHIFPKEIGGLDI